MKTKRLKNFLFTVKKYNDDLFMKNERITIIDRSQLFIQNYGEIIEIKDESIKLSRILITGNNLKIISVSKYFIEITGIISDMKLGEIKNE